MDNLASGHPVDPTTVTNRCCLCRDLRTMPEHTLTLKGKETLFTGCHRVIDTQIEASFGWWTRGLAGTVNSEGPLRTLCAELGPLRTLCRAGAPLRALCAEQGGRSALRAPSRGPFRGAVPYSVRRAGGPLRTLCARSEEAQARRRREAGGGAVVSHYDPQSRTRRTGSLQLHDLQRSTENG